MNMPIASPVFVRVLGGFELHGAQGGELSVSGRKLRALVALLSLPPSLGWSREQLTALLWGEREDELARGSLRQALAELRRTLGDTALLTDRDTVAFDPVALNVDAAEFGRLSTAGDWESAAALYRGDLLTGVSLPNGAFADWLLVERARLHDLALRALGRVLDTKTGDEAIATAQKLLALEPTHEETHRKLMRLLAAGGERAQALRQYQLCRDRLWNDLGVKPEPETERLFAEIRSSSGAVPRPRESLPAPAPSPGEPAPSGLAAGPSRPRRRWTLAAVVLAVGVVVGLAGWLKPWESSSPSATPGPPSIAVLPFENRSEDPQQTYFADGIAEDLMTDLSRVSGLLVIARNSTFAYRDHEVDVQKAARALGARYVIAGSVRRANDQVRINVQLIDAASGRQQWADRYDGPLDDIFALQDAVTEAVVNALSLRLSAGEQRELTQHETASLDAYDAFLRGWSHYKRATPEELTKAVPYLEQAIELDPAFGRAHAALAMIYLQAYDQRWAGSLGLSANDAYRRARDHLRIAEQYPTSTAHQVAGNMSRGLGWYDDALNEYAAATALDPNDSWSYAYAAHALILDGRPAEAEARIQMALRLDPHPPPVFVFYQGWSAFAQGRLAEAATAFETATDLDPDNPWPWLYLVATYGSSGRSEAAQVALAEFDALRIGQGGIPLTLDCYYLQGGAFYLTPGTFDLREGLRLAGVPRWLEAPVFEPRKLGAAEVDSLFFGHRLHGRSLESGEEHGASITADGSAMMFGDWGFGNGSARLEGDGLCFEWTGGHTNCGMVYRNPGGTRIKENEFVWFSHAGGGFPFSQVD
jgi:adenylate cyclase